MIRSLALSAAFAWLAQLARRVRESRAYRTALQARLNQVVARADLADLRGVRFVITSEVEKQHKLSEEKIKRITRSSVHAA